MKIEDLKINDLIVNVAPYSIELVITDLSDEFMIQNEVSCLINNSGCVVYREVTEQPAQLSE